VRIRSPSTVLLYALPLALLLVAVILGVVYGHRSIAPSPERPLALPPVEAPDATGPDCSALLAVLPDRLPATPGELPRKAIAEPKPPGAMAWAGAGSSASNGVGSSASNGAGSTASNGASNGAGDPVVLRCGLPKPAELGPGAALLDVNGVSWLTVSEPDRDSFFTVGRRVFVALTVPRGMGSGPIQAVSDVVRSALPPG
jgi:hypothetical protein